VPFGRLTNPLIGSKKHVILTIFSEITSIPRQILSFYHWLGILLSINYAEMIQVRFLVPDRHRLDDSHSFENHVVTASAEVLLPPDQIPEGTATSVAITAKRIFFI
jgi:hypothetical protein